MFADARDLIKLGLLDARTRLRNAADIWKFYTCRGNHCSIYVSLLFKRCSAYTVKVCVRIFKLAAARVVYTNIWPCHGYTCYIRIFGPAMPTRLFSPAVLFSGYQIYDDVFINTTDPTHSEALSPTPPRLYICMFQNLTQLTLPIPDTQPYMVEAIYIYAPKPCISKTLHKP